jgi:general stress protein YciG
MDRAKQREIASKGGKAAHQKGTAHEWTSEEARDAGRKGGIASHQRRREQLGGGTTSENTSSDENDENMKNASSESMRSSGSSRSMRSAESMSHSSSSMDEVRDDYSQRDGWSRDE